MKTKFTLFLSFIVLSFSSYSQELLAGWTFPSGTYTDSLSTGGLTVNNDKALSARGGTSAIDFTKNGATTKSAQVTGWDNGNNTKYWQIKVTTTGYNNITLSSAITSGGNNPGPRDFKVQVKVGASGTWIDVSGSAITVGNDWTSGVTNNLALPATCNSQALVFIRWIMTSNVSHTGGDIAASGISKIDDVFVRGTLATGFTETSLKNDIKVYFSSIDKSIKLVSSENLKQVQLFSISGVLISQKFTNDRNISLNCSGLNHGIYIVKAETNEGTVSKKVIISTR